MFIKLFHGHFLCDFWGVTLHSFPRFFLGTTVMLSFVRVTHEPLLPFCIKWWLCFNNVWQLRSSVIGPISISRGYRTRLACKSCARSLVQISLRAFSFFISIKCSSVTLLKCVYILHTKIKKKKNIQQISLGPDSLVFLTLTGMVKQ